MACEEYQENLTAVATALGQELSTKMTAVADKYKKEAADEGQEAPDPGVIGGTLNIDFDVDWANISIKFDLPEFKMDTQEWKFDVPKVTMKDNEMIFHTPSTRMVPHKVGQYPEFHGLFTVEWKDIITDIPEFFMEEQRIVMGIPEFRMDTQTISLDVPQVTMKTQEIIMGLPQFTLKSVSGEVAAYKQTMDGIKTRATGEVTSTRANVLSTGGQDITKAASSLFTCLRTTLNNKKLETLALLDPAINMLTDSISKFSSINADEARVKVTELQGQLQDAVSKRANIVTQFDAQIDALVKQEQTTIADMLSKLSG